MDLVHLDSSWLAVEESCSPGPQYRETKEWGEVWITLPDYFSLFFLECEDGEQESRLQQLDEYLVIHFCHN